MMARKGPGPETSTPGSAQAVSGCTWRTGAHACRMPTAADRRCGWHRYWIRLVDGGNVGRQQYDEFCDWWEQFQPYGTYADNPGPWWAAIEALWPAMTGLGDPPVLTAALENELVLRRAEVRRFRVGVAWGRDPWPRVSGLPLPVWEAAAWQAKAGPVPIARVSA